ncbi:hypothetical protein BGX28_002599 [Mortierella sp. GBA30]|nr:hypothetical protein BGX28_002599 [Mortierella sp. GBA30]
MSPPHSTPWDPSEAGTEPFSHERPLKAYRQLSPSGDPSIKRPWTNAEQEALYVAVERHKLFGQWTEIQDRMSLDRSPVEIEQEYMRLYGELADSDDDDEWVQQRTAESAHYHMQGHVTPALTTASSLSARSSQETFSSHYGRSSHPPPTSSSLEPIRRPQHRKPMRSTLDDYQDDEAPETKMDVEPRSSGPRLSSGGKGSAARPRSDSAMTDAKPTRTVRVWTQQQSEQLKNLIEDCFPGGYRINWVWVASQMGNTFTRKQCKNKWEIMRRRAGTEEEINLLKQGHEEFGPSWSQIQEKYLPERSQGGISIMWNLLQAREAEQEQQSKQRQSAAQQGGDSQSETMNARSNSGSPIRQRKEATGTNDSMRTSSAVLGYGDSVGRRGKDRPYRPRVAPYPLGDEQEASHHQVMDREMTDRRHSEQYSYHESTSRETSMSPLWRREGAPTEQAPVADSIIMSMAMETDAVLIDQGSSHGIHRSDGQTAGLARHSKRASEYVPWTDEEVERLKQGVERFGRSWTDIQHHYLKERSVGSMASKWDYLLLKMRSTPKTSPSRGRSVGRHQHQVDPGLSGGEMEDEDEERAGPYTDIEQDEMEQ